MYNVIINRDASVGPRHTQHSPVDRCASQPWIRSIRAVCKQVEETNRNCVRSGDSKVFRCVPETSWGWFAYYLHGVVIDMWPARVSLVRDCSQPQPEVTRHRMIRPVFWTRRQTQVSQYEPSSIQVMTRKWDPGLEFWMKIQLNIQTIR
jgi:hypothetical protein